MPLKTAAVLPHLIDAPLHFMGLINFWQFLFHTIRNPLSIKKAPSFSAQGEQLVRDTT
jgi:hypothetical protein